MAILKLHQPALLDLAEAFLSQQDPVVSVVAFGPASGVILTVAASEVAFAAETVVATVAGAGGLAIREAEVLAVEVGTAVGDPMDLALPLQMLLLALADVVASEVGMVAYP